MRRTASLALLAAATLFSTAASAHPGLPGHTHDGLDSIAAMIAVGAFAASLTVLTLLRRRSLSA